MTGMFVLMLLLFLAWVAVVFAIFYFLAKRLIIIGGKACPHCAEKIKGSAKVCRYCQRDVAGIEIESKTQEVSSRD